MVVNNSCTYIFAPEEQQYGSKKKVIENKELRRSEIMVAEK
jgi:hypothetical protein